METVPDMTAEVMAGMPDMEVTEMEVMEEKGALMEETEVMAVMERATETEVMEEMEVKEDMVVMVEKEGKMEDMTAKMEKMADADLGDVKKFV